MSKRQSQDEGADDGPQGAVDDGAQGAADDGAQGGADDGSQGGPEDPGVQPGPGSNTVINVQNTPASFPPPRRPNIVQASFAKAAILEQRARDRLAELGFV